MPGRIALSLWLAAVLAAAGCGSPARGTPPMGPYRTVTAAPRRDTDAAKHANQAGLQHLAHDELDRAAEAFERALTADVEFGPAHNNLGLVHYRRQDWYKAAWEFEYARKLMPKRAEPRNNLGLVLERAGDFDRAVGYYREAVELDPANVPYRGNLVRALIRRGDRTEEVRALLKQLLEQDTRPDWLMWAKRQQASMGQDAP